MNPTLMDYETTTIDKATTLHPLTSRLGGDDPLKKSFEYDVHLPLENIPITSPSEVQENIPPLDK